MTDENGYNGHRYPRNFSWINVDPNAKSDQRPRPCTKKTWCTLDEKHDGDCPEVQTALYDHPQRPIDHHLMARPKTPPKAPEAKTDVVWPAPGAKFQDSDGRTLTITEIHPASPIDRHVVGKLDDGAAYACSRIVFDATWKELR